jgi:phage-related holin
VIALVFIDTAFGIMRAGKRDVKQIKSRKLFSLVTKSTAYFLLVILAQSISYVEPQIPFVKLALFGIGFIEIKSIDENFRGIFGYSFIDKILQALKFVKDIKRKGEK